MLRETTDSPAQRLLITLLADYREVFRGAVPSGLLVDIMAELDVSPDAIRTAFSRLVKRDILSRTKTGRATSYELSPHGLELVTEAAGRIMSFGESSTWDGMWTLVTFSVGEGQRHLRHQLRTRLRAVGFTPLYDGVWAAAHATVEEARDALAASEVTDAIVFRGTVASGDMTAGHFYDAWKLDELRGDYERFIQVFEPLLERVTAGAVSPAESLVARTKVMDAWRVFPRRDPDLPPGLLPADWPRSAARNIFLQSYEALAPTAALRLTMLLDSHQRAT